MDIIDEIDELINAIKEKCPNVVISQLTSFGEKPLESGVWRFWHKDNEDVRVSVEVHQGMLYALYASQEFENKYPINATKICEFLNAFGRD